MTLLCIGIAHAEVSQGRAHQSWLHPGELEHGGQWGDAQCSMGRIWLEWILFGFGQLMSVPVGEDGEHTPPNDPLSAPGAAHLLHPPQQPILLMPKAPKSGNTRDRPPSPTAKCFSFRSQVSCPRFHFLSPKAAPAWTTHAPSLWALVCVPELWVPLCRAGRVQGCCSGWLGRRGRLQWEGCRGNYLPYCALACV